MQPVQKVVLTSTTYLTAATDAVALAALASQAAPSKHNVVSFSNCKKQGHIVTYCVSPGGGMAGKTIEECKAARQKDQESKKTGGTTPSPPRKFPVSIKGANGQVYTAYMDTPLPSDPAFVSAATTDPTIIMLPSNTIEYAGWIALEDNLRATVDWRTQTHPVDMTALTTSTICSLSQTAATPISCDTHPFWLDMGASVHVTPDHHNFKSL
ncbi:hypothetical protein BU17DRAFT_99593 [Hysterangium stoloniferum]|nr:hypothetical protein BU17DRAFT_99593 [Hysterangium stoloniferum]